MRGPFESCLEHRRNAALLHVAAALLVMSYGKKLAAEPAGEPAKEADVWSIFGGYTSHELANVGVHAGVDYALIDTRHVQSLLTGSLQIYHQDGVETGYALHVRWGQRYTSSFGLAFESYLGVGAQYTQYETPVFEFDAGAAHTSHRRESLLGFSPHVVFGPSYDFSKLLCVPAVIYARPGVMLLYPDLNLAFQASVIGELGFRWTFGRR